MSLTIRLVLYPIFALFCLIIFSFLLFPFEALTGRIQSEIGKTFGDKYDVAIEKVSPALFTGLVLKKVKLQERGKEKSVLLDRAKVKIGLFPLLWGTKSLTVDLRAGKGRVEGSVKLDQELTRLDLEVDEWDVSLSRLFLPETVPFVGSLNGEIILDLYSADPLRNSGHIELEVQELGLAEGAGAAGLALPALNLAKQGGENSRIDIDVVRGNWELKTLKLIGSDINFEATGKVYAAKQVKNYRLNLQGNFVPQTGSEEKMPFLGLIEAQKQEGKFPFAISGRLTKPSIRIGTFKLPI
ncbi:MAG: type II secretion system protein GspN [Deltaproteobacteria bacterium]|nr:type II secretion system protein GspN [Deltaproteobacteria bacterium]